MARTLGDLGEFELIERIGRLAGAPPRAGAVRLGIGDDAALVRLRAGEDLAVSTDAFVEGVHFRFDHESPKVAGARAAAAALSDLAAMGARPLAFTSALAAPPALELATVLALHRGLIGLAERHGCALAGGNVTRARDLSLALTVLGALPRGKALRRRGARAGDRILVTGTLGGPALARVRGRVRQAATPRLDAGRALLRSGAATACIDVSDGLLADLGHLCRASRVGAELDARRVPRPHGFAAACRRAGADADRLVLAGGEDYELLFTARAGAAGAEALARALGVAVSEIGRIRAEGLHLRGAAPAAGWRHF